MKTNRYVASELIKMLALRHSKDVFIPECKDGPTQSVSRYLRMDAWAMNKSWAHPVAFAYEVKVSRSDFLQDNKWPAYLPLCNQFYFVAPAGLVDISELPAEVGLLTAAGKGDGGRLITKKKAPHRDVQIPEEVYRYILMCRVQVADEKPLETTEERWRNWLEKKSENRRLGYEVSKRIRERASELEAENSHLKFENEQYADLKNVLAAMQVNIHDWRLQEKVKDRIRAQERVFNEELINAMRDARNKIDTALTVAQQLEDAAREKVA